MGLNILLGSESNISINISRVQKKIRDHFFNLLSRERKSVEPKVFRHKYKWKKINDDDLLKSELEGTLGDCPYVLPLHKAIKLSEDMIQIILQEHIRELHTLARNKSQGIDVNKCRLCGVTTKTIQDLRNHLQEPNHKTKELKLFED